MALVHFLAVFLQVLLRMLGVITVFITANTVLAGSSVLFPAMLVATFIEFIIRPIDYLQVFV